MSDQRVFADDWRDCLRAQYLHVIRSDDTITGRSLVAVLLSIGFRESDLAEWRRRARLNVDDVADDFVPAVDNVAVVLAPSSADDIIDDDVSLVIVDLAPVVDVDSLEEHHHPLAAAVGDPEVVEEHEQPEALPDVEEGEEDEQEDAQQLSLF